MRTAFIAGIVLVALSARPLFLMGRELAILETLRTTFQLRPHYDDVARIGNTAVQLVRSDKQHLVSDSPVRVQIGGRDYSVKSFASSLLTVSDRATGKDRVAVVQYLGGDGTAPFERSKMHWRFLWVSDDGNITDETFTYADRCNPPIRSMLVNFATPTPIGCKSDLMQVWPSLIYPILYPWSSGALGIILIVICGGTLLLQKRKLATSA